MQNTRTVTGWVDSTDLFYEFGEHTGPLRVYSEREDLINASSCIGSGEHDCRAVQITITYTINNIKQE